MMEKAFEYKMAILIRNDITIGKGKIAVQAAHAAVSASYKTWRENRELFKYWYNEGQRKIVLKVSSLKEMLEIKKTADHEGFITALIEDAGLTQVPPGTITALGIGPEKEEKLDELTKYLKLL